MEEEEYPRPTHEFRVWCETGDLMGYAQVYRRNGWYTVESDPFKTSEKWITKGFRSESDALSYAESLADRYLAEAIADATEELGEPPVGVMSEHGYDIQIVENEA